VPINSTLGQLPFFSIFDRLECLDKTILRRNIKFIVEVLCKQIYNHSGIDLDVSQQSLKVSETFVDSWLKFLSSQPRPTPFLTKESPVVVQLEKTLNAHTAEIKKTTFPLDAGMTFYQLTGGNNNLQTQMQSYRVKPFLFDVFLAIGIVLYLSLLHLFFKAPSSSLFGLLRNRPVKK